MSNQVDVLCSDSSVGRRSGAGSPARRSSRVLLFAAILGVAVLSSACADRGAAQSGAAATAGQTLPQVAGSTADPANARIDPLAPAKYGQVLRHGKRPSPTVSANQGRFSKAAPVRYPDGVSLQVTGVKAGVETGLGPGAFPGRWTTAISLSLVNRSKRAIDLRQVVVTAMYGSPARLAPPVYETAVAKDFNAVVKAGGSVSATYVFAIPTAQIGNVVMIIDFDGTHVAARFTGPAQ